MQEYVNKALHSQEHANNKRTYADLATVLYTAQLGHLENSKPGYRFKRPNIPKSIHNRLLKAEQQLSALKQKGAQLAAGFRRAEADRRAGGAHGGGAGGREPSRAETIARLQKEYPPTCGKSPSKQDKHLQQKFNLCFICSHEEHVAADCPHRDAYNEAMRKARDDKSGASGGKRRDGNQGRYRRAQAKKAKQAAAKAAKVAAAREEEEDGFTSDSEFDAAVFSQNAPNFH